MIQTIHKKIIWFLEKGYWVFFIAASLVLAVFCFHHLDVKYVDSWDEARHGVNAYEMIQNENYIQHTYNYEVDDWNLKPSLSYWGILLGFWLFGYTVFGLRFYAALCYLLTGIVTGLWVGKRSRAGSILVMGFFCANTLPLYAHLARAGDADSLYLMLFTFAMLAMLEIPKNKKYLYICGLCFSLAFLTKSWHAGMIAAIGGLYLLLTGEIRRIRWKEWAGFLTAVFLPLVLWFGWRYQADGFTFLRQMVEVDLLARTGTSNFEGHSGPFTFYWDMVFGNTAYIYPWLVGICVIGAAAAAITQIAAVKRRKTKGNVPEKGREKNIEETGKERKTGSFPKLSSGEWLALGLWFGITFLGFSLMKTKLIWYCYPAVIPLFVAAALILGQIIEFPDKKRMAEVFSAAQLALAAGCVVLVAHFMLETYDTAVRSVHGDGFQDFLQLSARQDSPYAGMDAYIQVPGEKEEQLGDWDQNRLFLAEINGNFRCKDGGVQGFLEAGENSVLYIDRENYAANEWLLKGCKVLCLCEGYPYVVLGK